MCGPVAAVTVTAVQTAAGFHRPGPTSNRRALIVMVRGVLGRESVRDNGARELVTSWSRAREISGLRGSGQPGVRVRSWLTQESPIGEL